MEAMTDGDERLAMNDEDCLDILWSQHHRQIEFNQLEVSIQAFVKERTIPHLFVVGQSAVSESYRDSYDVVIEKLEARAVWMIWNEDLEHHMGELQSVRDTPTPSCHDVNVYVLSPLGHLLENYQVAVPRSNGGTELPPIVQCHQAFPLARKLMKPCCILHNVCKTLNNSADKQWVQDARKVEEDDKLEQPRHKT
ncbi:hypothetical protein HPB47_013403 [Ixodes persulcatus]|uniref:Uncharacterized protein n=1 Tax=Ixodes persulcatus TaxID=34615 RepID=A0AC60QYK8_IXOPE|nr:hypothetical protein HPB47_013403 [Ixodes persulcatus]